MKGPFGVELEKAGRRAAAKSIEEAVAPAVKEAKPKSAQSAQNIQVPCACGDFTNTNTHPLIYNKHEMTS